MPRAAKHALLLHSSPQHFSIGDNPLIHCDLLLTCFLSGSLSSKPALGGEERVPLLAALSRALEEFLYMAGGQKI